MAGSQPCVLTPIVFHLQWMFVVVQCKLQRPLSLTFVICTIA